MELKLPIKKGYKTPRYRPPLPILNDSSPGLSVEEYDWPLFNGYYNGTSVIIDDPRGIIILTNKGFFGKGSLSKGCPNLAKRKIPNNVVYESQWKRRKQWMEKLNLLLKGKDFLNNAACSESIVDNEIDGEKISDVNNKLIDAHDMSSSTKDSQEEKNNEKEEDVNSSIKDSQEEKNNEKEDMNSSIKDSQEEKNNEKEEDMNSSIKDSQEEKNNEKEEDMNSSIKDSQEEKNNEKEEDMNSSIKDSQEEKNNEKEEVSIGVKGSEIEPHILEHEKSQIESCNLDKKEQISGNFSQHSQNEDPSKDTKITNFEIDVSSNQFVNEQSKRIMKICDSSYYTNKGILKANEVLVISDIRNDLEVYFKNLNPHIEEEKTKTAVEVLYLSLEEAFFLSYACNCLQIVDLSTNILGIKEMWVLFQNSQVDFIEKYVTYHYFRAKGWVVKSGTKFGGDFLLYKKGPLYFHASYIVIVELVKNDSNVKRKLTWQKIIGMNRMAESATKEIIISHVIWPTVEKERLSDPSILKEFSVSETLLRRWQATQEKNG